MQLLRVMVALEGHETHVVAVQAHGADVVIPARFHRVRDANRWNKVGIIILAMQMLWFSWRIRPEIVVTTGAAPGFFAIWFGKMFGARTIWIDSIANAAEISLSGRLARRYSDLWLTQWPQLARTTGASYYGSLL